MGLSRIPESSPKDRTFADRLLDSQGPYVEVSSET